MSAILKEVVQEIIKDNTFQNPGKVLTFLKGLITLDIWDVP